MAEELYPVFDIPDVEETETEEEEILRSGPLFDFNTGDFVRDGQNRVILVDGQDTFILWVLKALKTQQDAYRSYFDFGIDGEDAMAQPDRQAVQVAFERTITEALLVHPATEKVYGFEYEWASDELQITFLVKPKDWEAMEVSMSVS